MLVIVGPSIIQVGCPTCCYQVCALNHAKVGDTDRDYPSEPCHRNDTGKIGTILMNIIKAFTEFFSSIGAQGHTVEWLLQRQRPPPAVTKTSKFSCTFMFNSSSNYSLNIGYIVINF